jgi:hypothetical protein
MGRKSRLLVVLSLFISSTTFATKVIHQNVVDMARLAGTVFVGACTEAAVERVPFGTGSLPCTRYVFDVLEPVKGAPGSRVMFRQLGTPSGAGHVVGMPEYRVGESYLLFLLPESSAGLTSPVGLYQGAFEIVSGEDGQQLLNLQDNLGVFHGVDASTTLLSEDER